MKKRENDESTNDSVYGSFETETRFYCAVGGTYVDSTTMNQGEESR